MHRIILLLKLDFFENETRMEKFYFYVYLFIYLFLFYRTLFH